MINRQQGFTLLEVMAALAIFSMLSVLAFMIFSQASELHQRSQKEIQQFNQLQRAITILDNDLLQLVIRRNRGTDKIIVLGEEAIFTTQSRDPQAPLNEAQTLQTVHWYLRNHTLYRAVRTSVDSMKDQPAQAMLENVEGFLLKVTAGKARSFPLRHSSSEYPAVWRVTASFCFAGAINKRRVSAAKPGQGRIT